MAARAADAVCFIVHRDIDKQRFGGFIALTNRFRHHFFFTHTSTLIVMEVLPRLTQRA